MAEPLKSALSIGYVEETSLALPSDKKLRSGQQRVLDQVNTIQRSKSKYRKSTSGSLSPTFQFNSDSPQTASKTIFFSQGNYNGNSQSKLIQSKPAIRSRTQSAKEYSDMRSRTNFNQWRTSTIPLVHSPNYPVAPQQRPREERYTSRSDSGRIITSQNLIGYNQQANTQAKVKSNGTINRTLTNSNGLTSQSLTNGYGITNQIITGGNGQMGQMVANSNEVTSKSFTSKTIGGEKSSDITMREAVEYVSSQDENYQHCGASFIQHNTFKDDKAKKEVLQLKGIQPLVSLLSSPNKQVQQTASAALRNLVFKNLPNKEEVQRCGGITEAVALLKDTDCPETQKQLTGLLWNLSSVDSLKPDMIQSALPVLMDSVIIPFTDQTSGANLDPEVFYNTTGCLRNLSCAKLMNRQAMRKCRGLIDSLVSYVQACEAADRPDDKSVENCVCVLHNLTYQLETEAPSHFNKINALAGNKTRETTNDIPPIGCFSQQSNKIDQEQIRFDYPTIEDSHPKGVAWLFHSKTMQTYLSLLGSSQKDATLEACCGALQNLTANQGTVSSVMSQAIVQKLNGLKQISPLLQSTNPSLQGTAVALVGNLSKNPGLQTNIARQILPELASVIQEGVKEEAVDGVNPDETVATACQTVHTLLKRQPELGKPLMNSALVNSLDALSRNGSFPKSSKAAALLLYSLWSEKDYQSIFKKHGMNKGLFVNEITTAAYKSATVIQ